ncbi:MAG: hypothetical protein PHV82_12955 [Victivallaceae bacterium]|nr:hypothetical protein [Victivallaceae bacterium]
MDYLVLEGSPYRIGMQKAKFDGNYLDKVMEYYDKEKNPQFDEWIKTKAIPYVEKEWPDMNEEIKGYIDVSGYSKNFFFKYIFSQVKCQFSCTNIVLYTEDAGFVCAKNTDLNYFESPNIFFYHYKPNNGYEFFCYDYKASFGGQGMNSIGFCQGGTSQSGIVERPGKMPEVGSPSVFIGRHNIQFAARANDASDNWKKHPFFDKGGAAINLDASGKSFHINRSMTICDIKENTQFPVYCSGFWNIDNYHWQKNFNEILKWGKAVQLYAEKFFRGKQKYYLQDLVDFLRSHGPDWAEYGQWCRHYPEDKHLCTVVSHICIPAQKTVLYCHGNPCENLYKEFSFNDND